MSGLLNRKDDARSPDVQSIGYSECLQQHRLVLSHDQPSAFEWWTIAIRSSGFERR
jgi:hypothetical protein